MSKKNILDTYVSALRIALGANTLHQVQQQLTRHRLDTARQRLIMNVLREEVHGERQVV